MSEYMAQQMDRQIEGAQETYKSMCEEIEQLKARNLVLEAAIEYDKAPSDAEFEPPHPIFQLAQERDDFMLKCGAQSKEIEQLRARVAEIEHQRDKCLADIDRLNDKFELVANSVCAALERAGFDSIDDPGEAIDVLAEERDQLNKLVAAKNEALQSVIDECGNRPFTRMIAIAGLELKAAPQQEQEGESRE